MTTIGFSVRCLACEKSEELTIDYDMEAGNDEDLKDKQEKIVALTGTWLHVPTIKKKDIHLCEECEVQITDASENLTAWWDERSVTGEESQ